jgi:glycerol-3-phosphate acyltransferase PlsY
MVFLVSVTLGYLLGSIPFGLLLTRIAGLGDIREIGSGNVGATNVLRTGNKGLAAATLAGDILKGTCAALIARKWGIDAACLAGFSAFIGHLFPVWLNYRGGKGVATYIGVMIGVYSPAAVFFCIVWLATAWAYRYSSLAALVASGLTPLVPALFGHWPAAGLSAVMTALLFYRHMANIERLSSGEEPTIGGKGSSS